jgi:hypothetical protein
VNRLNGHREPPPAGPGERTAGELSAAADAHLLIRAALLEPSLLDRIGSGAAVASGALARLAATTLVELGSVALQRAAVQCAQPGAYEHLAEAVAALRELESDRQAIAYLERTIADLLEDTPDRQGPPALLAAVGAAARCAGESRTTEVARMLIGCPVAAAGARADDLGDAEADRRLRVLILARLAAVHPGLAGVCAEDVAATFDPNEPATDQALRNLAATWWVRATGLLTNEDIKNLTQPGPGPEPVRTLLDTLGQPAASGYLFDLAAVTAFVVAVETIATICDILRDPKIALTSITFV